MPCKAPDEPPAAARTPPVPPGTTGVPILFRGWGPVSSSGSCLARARQRQSLVVSHAPRVPGIRLCVPLDSGPWWLGS